MVGSMNPRGCDADTATGRRPGARLVAVALVIIGMVAAAAGAARAQGCAGDCDDSTAVAVNELVGCVGIGLGSAALATCVACDVDGNTRVAIQELVAAVGAALTGCPPPPAASAVARFAPAPAAAMAWGDVPFPSDLYRDENGAIRIGALPTAQPESPLLAAMRDVVQAYVALTKPRIIVLLLITTVPAMVLAAGAIPSLWLVAATLVGGAISAGSANAINMYLDRDIDEVMRRTRGRPLPAHAVAPDDALRFGFVLGASSFVFLAMTVNVLAAVLSLAAIAFYVFVYTMWLKRSTTQNIVIGGAAGAAPALVGWAAVTGTLAMPAWILFAIVFVWTPPHFWALAMRFQGDYAAAGVPMLPVVRGEGETRKQILLYSLALFGTTLVLVPVGPMGPLYTGAAIVLGGIFVYRALALWRTPSPVRSWGLFKYSVLYLGGLFAAVAADALVRST